MPIANVIKILFSEEKRFFQDSSWRWLSVWVSGRRNYRITTFPRASAKDLAEIVVSGNVSWFSGLLYAAAEFILAARDATNLPATFGRATENARPDIAKPSKLWGLTLRDWTTRHHIARVDIARPDNSAPD